MMETRRASRVFVLYGEPVSYDTESSSVSSLERMVGGRIKGDAWDGYIDFSEPEDPDTAKMVNSGNTGVGEISYDPGLRFSRSVGKSSMEIAMLSENRIPAIADAVLFPRENEVAGMMHSLRNLGIKASIYGGGTSVTGGLSPGSGQHFVSIDASHLKSFSMHGRIAVVGGGMTGFDAESEAEKLGLTLGFFPESFMHSTVGGWVSSMASGQESNRYGDIEDIVLGVELVRSDGTITDPVTPRSSTGITARSIALGSEGRNGIISKVYMKTSSKPARRKYASFIFRSFRDAIDSLSRLESFPDVLRVSDSLETELALSEAGNGLLKRVLERYLNLRGFSKGCIAVVIDSGDSYRQIDDRAARIVSAPAKIWERTRYERPLIANLLWKSGLVVDTLETSVSWDKAYDLYEGVNREFREILSSEGIRGIIMSHMSHQYREGCCLYFTFMLNTAKRTEHLKLARDRIISSFLKNGGSISHHHGIGTQLSGYVDSTHRNLMNILADPVLL